MSVQYDMTERNLRANGYRPLHAGDSYDHKFYLQRGGVDLDLTGAKVWLTVKRSAIEEDSQALLQLISTDTAEIEILDVTGGELVVKFRGSGAKSTEDLEGLWEYDLQVKLGDTDQTVITVATGKIEFLRNITRTTA